MIKKFKSLSDVLKFYNIHYFEANFIIVKTEKLNEVMQLDIMFTLKEIPYDISEAAICENLIYPLLKEAWKPYASVLMLWSHQALEDDTGNIRIPDYLISKRSALGKIIFDFPLLAVIEAKKDNFSLGWMQCSLDMIKIRQLHKNDNIDIYGLVSNGKIWEVAKLSNQQFIVYKNRFFIEELDTLFNMLVSVLELCKTAIN